MIILPAILADLYDIEVFLFGSCANGHNRRWSDCDIGVRGADKVDHRTMAKTNLDLDESNLPIKVDVVDFNQASEKFEKIACQHTETWHRPL